MTLPMVRITNLWSKVITNPDRPMSRVVVESVGQPAFRAEETTPGQIVLTVHPARANMYCQAIDIHDGLVEQVQIVEAEDNQVIICISANHPAPWQLSSETGIPHRTVISLCRDHLVDVFQRKVVLIDPGHGGTDAGGRGPVDLLEKNVVLNMAESLDKIFRQVGLQVHFTRRDDQELALPARYKAAARLKAHFYIGLHTHYDRDENVCGLAVRYNPKLPESRLLAELTAGELFRKIKRPQRGVLPDRQLATLGTVPGIIVEPVAISNWVEEGLLRNPTFYDKTAWGIFNGLRRFLTEPQSGNNPGLNQTD